MKKATEKKAKPAKKAPSAALAVVKFEGASAIAKLEPEHVELGLKPADIQKAVREHVSILSLSTGIDKGWTKLKAAIDSIKASNRWRLIISPETKKSFTAWAEYGAYITGKCPSGIFGTAKVIKELTNGANAIKLSELDKMSQSNAKTIAEEIPPEKRTPEVVKQAQRQTNREFKESTKAVRQPRAAKPNGKPVEPQRISFTEYVCLRIEKMWARTMEVAVEEVKDGDISLTLREKAVEAICVEFLQTHRSEVLNEFANHAEPANEPTRVTFDAFEEDDEFEVEGATQASAGR